ncbi:MAG: hypothetical protein RLZZ91_1472 [Bacteroidota bacterium]|jgi:hypothetical protein
MRKIGIPLFIFLALVVTSCLKVETYPDEPSVEAVRMTVSSDSAFLEVDFIDGDGNVGLGQEDTSGVFGACDTRYNLFCVYEELRNGTWMQISEDPCVNPNAVPFYYRVPWASPPGQNKTQKGTIMVQMYPGYYLASGFDTCRFAVRICDRDLNYSNTVYSPVYIKP